MKKLAAVATLSLLAVLIVLPAICSVKYIASNPIIADGGPMPWPFSTAAQSNTTLRADGGPMPWPFSAATQSDTTLRADGGPLPWPFSTQSSQLA